MNRAENSTGPKRRFDPDKIREAIEKSEHTAQFAPEEKTRAQAPLRTARGVPASKIVRARVRNETTKTADDFHAAAVHSDGTPADENDSTRVFATAPLEPLSTANTMKADASAKAAAELPSARPAGPAAPGGNMAGGKKSAPENTALKLERLTFSVTARFIFSLFFAVLAAWIDISAVLGYPLPTYVSVNDSVAHFALANLCLLLLSSVLCGPELLRGAKHLVTLSPDTANFVVVAVLGALVSDTYLLFNPSASKAGVLLYTGSVCLVTSFYLLGRVFSVRRTRGVCHRLSEQTQLYDVKSLHVSQAIAGTGGEEKTQNIAVPIRAEKTGDIPALRTFFAATPADSVAAVLPPILLIGAVAVLLVSLLTGGSTYAAISSFAAVCCIGAPTVLELSAALPFSRISKRLRRRGAFLTGYGAVRTFSSTDLVSVDARMLFSPERSVVYGIKTYAGYPIEQAILDAASVLGAADGPLALSFRALIEGEAAHVLEIVSNVTYRDDMGLSAMIDSRRVLLGNRDLLRANGIPVPPHEMEAKYIAQGRDVLYLAVGDRLTALFIVGYGADADISSAIKRLGRAGVSLLVRTVDANITPELIEDCFKRSFDSVKILSGEEAALLETVGSRDKGAASGLSFTGGMRSFADAVTACIRLAGTLSAVTVLSAAGALLGVLAAVYFTFVPGIHGFTPVYMLLYQGIWAVPPLLVALFRRN